MAGRCLPEDLHLGDPDFNPDAPVTRLLSKEYAATLRTSIDPHRASRSRPDGPGTGTGNTETTHYAVVDAEGNAVVVTTTLEDWYGSKIVAPGTGFLLNNEMGDFNPVPGRTDSTGLVGTPPNLVAPGKRMLSSMTPTILLRVGRPWLLIGSPGGRTIINTVLQVIVDMVDFGMDLGEAVAAPRIHHQWLPDVLRVEKFGASPETVARLREMGHRVLIRGSSREQGRAMGIVIVSPARVNGVYLNEHLRGTKTATIVVPEDQLSLAIGRDGQNARLAAKLTSWRIDIKSLPEAAADALHKLQTDPEYASLAELETCNVAQIESVLAKKSEGRPVTPEEYSALSQFVDRVERGIISQRQTERKAEKDKRDAVLATIPPLAFEMPIEDLAIPDRLHALLVEAGYITIGDVMLQLRLDSDAILGLNGVGPKSMQEIEEALAGLSIPSKR